jgi:S1-C subfamily serine protease
MKDKSPGQPCRRQPWALIASLTACLAAAATAEPPNTAPTATAQPANSVPVDAKTDVIEKSVVKIFTTVRYPDYFRPWSKQSPTSLVGSGVVIEGKRILSNAHLVLYASQVQIEANEAGDKISGTVVGVSPDMDLAVIKLDDESFFDSHPPLARAKDLPGIKDAVMVYGFPTGGSSMSITKGIVSRIEFTKYNYGAMGLRIQVDAAINPGNSGGPAVVGDKMIGLAFAHLSKSENISYIIPCEEIGLFLKNMVNGMYHGRPLLHVKMQTLENSALRSFLQLDKSVHGAVIQQVPPLDSDNPLRKWDVVTEIGQTPIDDEGMIKVDGDLRVVFTYLLTQTAVNGKAPVTVMRAGKLMHLQVPVTSDPPLVMQSLKGSYSSYFVYGPLVFSTATPELLISLTAGQSSRYWTPVLMDQGSPLLRRIDDSPEFEGEELVVVTAFFPHKLTRGYNDPTAQVVKSIDGITVKNLAQMVEILRDGKSPFVIVDFDGRNTDTLVFRRADMLADSDEILTDNNVRSQGSADVMAIWNAKKH